MIFLKFRPVVDEILFLFFSSGGHLFVIWASGLGDVI